MSAQPKPHPVPRLQQPHRRGEVWFVSDSRSKPSVGNEIWPERPAVVLSANTVNSHTGVAVVVYLTSSATTKGLSGPTRVEVLKHDRSRTSVALCEQVTTVDASRMVRRIDAVSPEEMSEIEAAVGIALRLGHNDGLSLYRKWERQVKRYGLEINKEIAALAGEVSDNRVEALERAWQLTALQRDAYKALYESAAQMPAAAEAVKQALSEHAQETGDDEKEEE